MILLTKCFIVNRDVRLREDVFPFEERAPETQYLIAGKLNETLVNWSDMYIPDMMLSHDTSTVQIPPKEPNDPRGKKRTYKCAD